MLKTGRNNWWICTGVRAYSPKYHDSPSTIMVRATVVHSRRHETQRPPSSGQEPVIDTGFFRQKKVVCRRVVVTAAGMSSILLIVEIIYLFEMHVEICGDFGTKHRSV